MTMTEFKLGDLVTLDGPLYANWQCIYIGQLPDELVGGITMKRYVLLVLHSDGPFWKADKNPTIRVSKHHELVHI